MSREVTLCTGGTQNHLTTTQGKNAKVVSHEHEVTLWEVRCYLYDVQSTNDEHLEKLLLYRPLKSPHVDARWKYQSCLVCCLRWLCVVEGTQSHLTSMQGENAKPSHMSCKVTLCGGGTLHSPEPHKSPCVHLASMQDGNAKVVSCVE